LTKEKPGLACTQQKFRFDRERPRKKIPEKLKAGKETQLREGAKPNRLKKKTHTKNGGKTSTGEKKKRSTKSPEGGDANRQVERRSEEN